MFAEKGGIQGVISFVPLSDLANALEVAIQTRNTMKRDLYEITGISDIVRGQAVGGRATATEQRIKGQFANLRLSDRQNQRRRFDRRVMRIEAEIIAEHFDKQSILMISGWQHTTMARALDKRSQETQEQTPTAAAIFDEAVELLRSDKLRSMRIDVEAGTTVLEDAGGEKKQRTEFLAALGQFLGQALPAGEKYPELAPALIESLFFGIRGFKSGRQLEQAFEHAVEDMARAGKNRQDPEAQAKAQEQQQKAAETQAAAQTLQMKGQIDQAKGEAEMRKIQMQAQVDEAEHEFTMREIAAKHKAAMEEGQLDLVKGAADAAEDEADRGLKRRDQALEAREQDLRREELEKGGEDKDES